MSYLRRSQVGGVVSVLLLCVAFSAHAQDSASTNSSTNSSSGSSSGPVLGPPALKDFQLEPRERLVTQPAPTPQRAPENEPSQPSRTAPPPPVENNRPLPNRAVANQPEPGPARPDRLPDSRSAAPNPPPSNSVPPIQSAPQTAASPVSPADLAPLPPAASQASPAAPSPEAEGGSGWLYLVPLFALLVVGFAILRRRRRAERIEEAEAVPVVDQPTLPPARTRTEVSARPWLELDLKAQRASFTDTEWVVQFELSVSNTGPIAARNLRIDVMLFNAGKEQDKEISAFFRTAGRESTKLNLRGIQAGETGVIDGEVAMPLAEMRAMKLSDRTLFIPVVAVNGLYEWGDGGSGQTAKSYIVGRELQEPSDKMGAFRIDLGPRIWRMVGQRPHKLARRF